MLVEITPCLLCMILSCYGALSRVLSDVISFVIVNFAMLIFKWKIILKVKTG